MPQFKYGDLPEKTLIMHNSQVYWRKNNWRDSLKNHNSDIEDLLSLIDLFNSWRNHLPRQDAVKSLIKEVYIDAYSSIHLSCYGLYKSAYMLLRSQFETTMRLIYFANHQLEFLWWKEGDEKWIVDLLKGPDVWGQNFKYFTFIPTIKLFDGKCSSALSLFKGNNPKLRIIYKNLSKHVHSGGPFLQTRSGRLSPKYNKEEFVLWYNMFKEVQKYLNILLALCFPDKLKKIDVLIRNQILNQAIGNDYKELIKEVCDL